jgi:hypothetical protein
MGSKETASTNNMRYVCSFRCLDSKTHHLKTKDRPKNKKCYLCVAGVELTA